MINIAKLNIVQLHTVRKDHLWQKDCDLLSDKRDICDKN